MFYDFYVQYDVDDEEVWMDATDRAQYFGFHKMLDYIKSRAWTMDPHKYES